MSKQKTKRVEPLKTIDRAELVTATGGILPLIVGGAALAALLLWPSEAR